MMPKTSQLKLSDLKRELRDIAWQYSGFNSLTLTRRSIPRGQSHVWYLAVRITPYEGGAPMYINIAEY